MEKYAYPDLELHRKLHMELIEDVSHIRERLSQGAELVALQAIKDWLIHHVRTTDRPMGEHVAREIRNDEKLKGRRAGER